MYRIIGADGQPYGPVTAEQLRQWINEGRVNGKTQVQVEGTDHWQPLAALPEFAEVFTAGHHAEPPRTPSLLPVPSTTPPPDPDTLVAEVLARNPHIDIGSCLSRGWNLVCGNFWLSVGVGFVGIKGMKRGFEAFAKFDLRGQVNGIQFDEALDQRGQIRLGRALGSGGPGRQ